MNDQNIDENWEDIREGIRAICKKFPESYWQKLDQSRSYPLDFVNTLTKSGYLSVLIPEKYGGAGLSIRAASVILEEIHWQGANGAACHAQMYIMGSLLKHGNSRLKEKYLPEIAKGSIRLQAFGVTEPTSGSDTLSIKTSAKKSGKNYIINGQKVWTSRAEYSDLILLLAKSGDSETKQNNLSLFLIDMRPHLNKSIFIKPIKTMINHSTTEVFFENLKVSESCLVGEEGKGFKYILDGMNAERILIASECLGDAKYFIDKAKKYANERIVFGRPIGKNQSIQFPISRAYANTRAAELMIKEACSLYNKNFKCGEESNLAKLLAADASWESADMAMQTFGGFSFSEEYNIERKFRETRLYRIAPVSTNMILAYLSHKVLGMPRSY
ncbi:MAG: Cyclohex-1-ene-1-carbonyl-CoA dehydrogenase [Alphaproteobacteria bacterium MarineAlpha9_Bin4]|nr:acyl-CoA dehydrogenase [Pelagibacterales bacterium]PPR27169.1 MAG: Cyclohex-1-ene-1-carbonyl-CoA dehydrogenase [Alphaproteobacteria bacterium MarineAlpha9_Bin4]|tara:strand:+ start:804 stop:1961 length:1158 start_codon:yes stop_codon:yes gene_type:complete